MSRLSDDTAVPPEAREEASTSRDDGPGEVLSVHVGPSANCSSVGSFVDFLFVSSVVGTAALSAFAVLLRRATDEPSASSEGENANADADRPEDAP